MASLSISILPRCLNNGGPSTCGILSRHLVFTTRSGAVTHLSWERFVSHDDSHLGAIRLSVQALGHARPVKLTFAIDG